MRNITSFIKEHKFKFIYPFFFAIIILIILFSIKLYWEAFSKGEAGEKQSYLGQYLSGTVGILLSFSGIIAIVIAFIAQRQQINSQKEEIRNNQYYNKITSFENKFFNLLKIYDNIVKQTVKIMTIMKVNDKSEHINNTFENETGRLAIKYYYGDFINDFLSKINKKLTESIDINNKREIFNNEYKKFMQQEQHIFGHYFRNIYHILKLIHISKSIFDKNDINSSDKFYSNILRAQLSSQELLFIFFNGLSDIALFNQNKLNYKRLVEEFAFFEHLAPTYTSNIFDNNERIAVLNLLDLYDKKAYGDNYDNIIQLFSDEETGIKDETPIFDNL